MVVLNFLLIMSTLIQCRADSDVEGRILNGEDASLGMFPYQVLLQFPKGPNSYIFCGGSLISDEYVLTAGHCSVNQSHASVFLGIIDSVDKRGGTRRKSSQIYVHPRFNKPFHLMHDISIIKLSKPVKETKNIKPIALPSRSQANVTNYDNKNATATGWGKTYNKEKKHRYLQYSVLHVGSHRFCSTSLKHHHFTKKQLCTDKTIYSTPCKGDSGGPLAYRASEDEEPIVIGIVSWGIGPCENDRPNVYTNVGSYLDYIHNITGIEIKE